MGYLITNLWLCMALAMLIGIVTGYWMWRQPNEEERFARDEDALPATGLVEDPVNTKEQEESAEDKAAAEEATMTYWSASSYMKDDPEELTEEPEEPAKTVPEQEDVSESPVAASPFLDAPDGDPDNLTLIKGVGPKLSDMLHGLGIFHFSQIARWDADQVAEVDSQLGNFKGRVARDQWVDQARFLSANDIAGFERQFGKINRPI